MGSSKSRLAAQEGSSIELDKVNLPVLKDIRLQLKQRPFQLKSLFFPTFRPTPFFIIGAVMPHPL